MATMKMKVTVELGRVSVADLVDEVVRLTLETEAMGRGLGDAAVSEYAINTYHEARRKNITAIEGITKELSSRCGE